MAFPSRSALIRPRASPTEFLDMAFAAADPRGSNQLRPTELRLSGGTVKGQSVALDVSPPRGCTSAVFLILERQAKVEEGPT